MENSEEQNVKQENDAIQNEEETKTEVKEQNEIIEETKINELETIKKELDDEKDRYQRIMAEFDNFKKRTQKEKLVQYDYILSDVVSSMLPVIDNLEKAVEAKSTDEGYKQGVELVYKQLLDVLTSLGVKEIEAVGKTFDPELHEAVSHVEDSTLGTQVIKEQFRKGYIIKDKVIRHSMVVVAN